MTSVTDSYHPDLLSQRARRWLSRGKRMPFFTEAPALVAFLESMEIRPTSALLEFELAWSGWECDGTSFGFVQQHRDGHLLDGIVYDRDPSNYLFECCMQDFEQFYTLMSEEGLLFDWVGDEVPPIQTSTSLRHLIEARVLFRQQFSFPDWYCLAMRSEATPEELAELLNLEPIPEASDDFEKWFQNECCRLHLRAHHAIWHDLVPGLWIHVLDTRAKPLLASLNRAGAQFVQKRNFLTHTIEHLVP